MNEIDVTALSLQDTKSRSDGTVSDSLEPAKHRRAELTRKEAALTSRVIELDAEITRLTAGLRDGALPSSVQLNTSAMELAEAKRQLSTVQVELRQAGAEVSRLESSLRRDELRKTFERMEQRRKRIISLMREAATELGELHTQDRQDAGRLCSMDMRSLERAQFNRLLEVIDPYQGWSDSMREVAVGFEHCIRIRPMAKL